MKKKKLNPQKHRSIQDWAEILVLTLHGASISETARRYNITRAAIYLRLKREALKPAGATEINQELPKRYAGVVIPDPILKECGISGLKDENVARGATLEYQNKQAEKALRAKKGQANLARELRTKIRQTMKLRDHGAGPAGNKASALAALTRSLKTLQDIEKQAIGEPESDCRQENDNSPGEITAPAGPVIVVPVMVSHQEGHDMLARYRAGEIVSCETITKDAPGQAGEKEGKS